MTAITPARAIDSAYALSETQIAAFRRDGFIKLKNVLSADEIAHYEPAISAAVNAASHDQLPLEKRGTYGKAFLQVMNLWERNQTVKTFSFSPRLARIATELLGTSGVRMYHDQALYKEASGGFTPWHVDQQYWPMASELSVTAWIPLQATPAEMGPLQHAIGSQQFLANRAMAISDESEIQIEKSLKDFAKDETPYDLGEVSFHYGYTFHRAGPNQSGHTRKVMTVIYMDEQMRLKEPENDNQKNDRDECCPGVAIGEIINSPVNPVLYTNRD